MVADKAKYASIPKIIQCSFQYVSIIDTIRTLFLRDDFLRSYQNYVTDNKHKCTSGVYSEFCCGSAFRNNELFQNHPRSLQIQIATDDFELCNPLSSKATLYKQCAIYFSIRNMSKLSNVMNIYLVALCNSNDIKTQQTDFNNLWEIIVKEIKYLEDVGIDVNESLNVKCTLVNLTFDNLGANQSLGLAEGFNAICYCRSCECTKEECTGKMKAK